MISLKNTSCRFAWACYLHCICLGSLPSLHHDLPTAHGKFIKSERDPSAVGPFQGFDYDLLLHLDTRIC